MKIDDGFFRDWILLTILYELAGLALLFAYLAGFGLYIFIVQEPLRKWLRKEKPACDPQNHGSTEEFEACKICNP